MPLKCSTSSATKPRTLPYWVFATADLGVEQLPGTGDDVPRPCAAFRACPLPAAASAIPTDADPIKARLPIEGPDRCIRVSRTLCRRPIGRGVTRALLSDYWRGLQAKRQS